MRYANTTKRIQGDSVDAWDLHYRAQADLQNGRDVILLSVGDPDFATPALICDAAIEALRAGDTHYTELHGRDALRDAIAEGHRVRSGQAVSRDNIIVMAGAQNALFSVAQCLFEPGDEVLVLQPAYLTYEACIQITGATMVPVALDAERGFRLDAETLRNAITPNTRAIVYATPNNPTGAVMTARELEEIAAVAIEHDLWVLADEVYCDICFDAPHRSIAALPGMTERTVTVNSLSKSHAMTGWRIGWAIAPPELIAHLYNLSLCMLYGLPGFIQEAGIHALTQASGEAARMRDLYRARRDLLVRTVAGIEQLDCVVPEAAMYLMVDVRGTGMPAGEFANALYDATGVSVLDATAFGASAAGFVRISYTLSEAQLSDACDRITAFMASIPSGEHSERENCA